MSDPFATDPFGDDADEAQTVAVPAPAGDAASAVWDGSVSLTFKGSGAHASSWYVVRAPSIERAAEILEDRDAVKRLVEAVTAVDKFIKAQDPTASSGGGGSQARPGGYGKPTGASQHPKGKTSECEHGPKTYASGQKKNGSGLWHAFDCPAKVCDREWTTA